MPVDDNHDLAASWPAPRASAPEREAAEPRVIAEPRTRGAHDAAVPPHDAARNATLHGRSMSWLRRHRLAAIGSAAVVLLVATAVLALTLTGTDSGDDAAGGQRPVDFTSGLGFDESSAPDTSPDPNTSSEAGPSSTTSPPTSAVSAPSSTAAGAGSSDSPIPAPATPVDVHVTAERAWYLQGGLPVHLKVEVCNRADHAVSQRFPTQQIYEIAVVDDAGEVVADDRDAVFLETATTIDFAPGECRTWDDSWVHSRGGMHTRPDQETRPALASLGDYRARVAWKGATDGPAESAAFSLRHVPPGVEPFTQFSVSAGTDRSSYAGGDTIEVELRACNQGSFDRANHVSTPVDFEVAVVDDAGDAAMSFHYPTVVEHHYPRIGPGECLTRTRPRIDGGDLPAGTYRLRARYLGREDGAGMPAVESAPFTVN